MAYISYLDLPKHWGLEKGDSVLLSSDMMQLTFTAMRNGERFDRDKFLDAILGVIGEEGTLLIPTFNWDFCHGIPFDYHKTPCKTGTLGTVALRHSAFRRTQHPLYSFAVAGKDQALLCGMRNVSSFGMDSPFGYLEERHGKNVLINLHYTDCFTFVHHCEEVCGVNTYRFQKTFTGQYIDEQGVETTRSYSMLVRSYELYLETDLTLIGEKMENPSAFDGISGLPAAARFLTLNDLPFRIVDLAAAAPIIKDDILNNGGFGICKHK
ncbi:MAG: AAC(3) family N-acetyltransferase [Prevotella sp.]|nr:AAC(3) family N-acetyltransferase [Prevotella sp.]